MTMLRDALAAEHVVLSSSGAHARQEWHQIIARKTADIARAGHTIWVVNSNATRPEKLHPFCNDSNARYVIFVSRARPKLESAKPKSDDSEAGPQTRDRARSYREPEAKWKSLPFWPKDPKGLSEVTGRITQATAGLWFEALEEISSGEINLRSYVKLSGEPLDRFHKHESAYPVRRSTNVVSDEGYQVLAVGRLAAPFAVWLSTRRVT
jgi:hypothetical protein